MGPQTRQQHPVLILEDSHRSEMAGGSLVGS